MEENKQLVLESLNEDLQIYAETLREVAEGIVSAGVSRYPIFIASAGDLDLGRQIVDRSTLATEWNLYASHLEEMVAKGIVQRERVEEFRQVYREHAKHMCLLVIGDSDGSFVFKPYP